MWSDFLIGSISYTIEDVGITLNSGCHGFESAPSHAPIHAECPRPSWSKPATICSTLRCDRWPTTRATARNCPTTASGRNWTPNSSVGDTTITSWSSRPRGIFPDFFKGHVIEADGRAGVAEGLTGGDVPFYDRYYLGGLYSLRGFKYRNIAPREALTRPRPRCVNEPIGGDSYWFGSLEYSIPILGKGQRRSACVSQLFYDVGAVGAQPYSFSGNFDDNWGLGFRLNIPHLGPLRLDYGIPITHDQYNGASGQFQFGVGYTREF